MARRSARTPDLVIGGAPRSGTTFLCELLDKHPSTYVAKPFIPEPKVLLGPADGDAAYLERYHRLFRDAPQQAFLIEKSSGYLENPSARTLFKHLLPEARILFVLRDPVERAFSNWCWSTKNGIESLPFEQAIEDEGSRPDPFGPDRAFVRPFDYIKRSLYGTHVSAWIDAIGADRVIIVQFEDVVVQSQSAIEHLLTSLSLDQIDPERLRTGVVNVGLADREIDPGMRTRLRSMLRSEMALLASIAPVDISRWGFDA